MWCIFCGSDWPIDGEYSLELDLMDCRSLFDGSSVTSAPNPDKVSVLMPPFIAGALFDADEFKFSAMMWPMLCVLWKPRLLPFDTTSTDTRSFEALIASEILCLRSVRR